MKNAAAKKVTANKKIKTKITFLRVSVLTIFKPFP